MKRFSALLLALLLALPTLCARAEAPGLLDELLSGIEAFDPETEDCLEVPEDPLTMDGETVWLDVSALNSFGLTGAQLLTDERTTRLPLAGLYLAMAELFHFTPESFRIPIYYEKRVSGGTVSLAAAMLNLLSGQGCVVEWVPGEYRAKATVFGGLAEFMNECAAMLLDMSQISTDLLIPYLEELRNPPGGFSTLRVGKASFELSPDRQSVFIDRPAITGGSGSFSVAYNIYDSDSVPVNYFYSDEERVAATPGYGGLFNVFIVVTDLVTGLSDTQNIGWQQLHWPYAEKLTVGRVAFERSPDGSSVFLTRPSVACAGGSVTIAYNIYDDQSRPVNYFYSAQSRVAASPGYSGRFNVFVAVTDTVTGETDVQNIGWQDLSVDNTPVYRALLLGMVNVPGNQSLPSSRFDVEVTTDVLSQVNGGAYRGRITGGVDWTREEVLNGIRTAFSGVKANDTSLFLFSSHGVSDRLTGTSAEDQEGALACGDGKLIKLKELAAALSAANPGNRVIVIISACGSGAAVKGSQAASLFARQAAEAFASADPGITVRRAENGSEKRRELCIPKFYVLTATDVYEDGLAFTGTSTNGSAGVVAFQQALRLSGGYMKADANRDRTVTFDELYAFAYNHARQLTLRHMEDGQHMQRYPESSGEPLFWSE